MSRRVAIYLPDGAVLSTAAAPTDLLQLANRFARERTGQDGGSRTRGDGAALSCRWLSLDGAAVRLASGSEVAVDGGIQADTVYDLVFLAAYDEAGDSDGTLPPRAAVTALNHWLRHQHQAGATLAACGNAVFLLAEAGLLDRQPATVPWWQQRAFHRRYPAVRLDATQQITEGERLLCASSLSGLFPLALRLVQRLTSPNSADWLAKTTLIDPAAKIETPLPQAPVHGETADALVTAAQYQLQQRYAEHAQLAPLADALSVSPRTLVRRFRSALGITPQAYVQQLRIESAKRMLVRTNLHVERIARQVGYSDLNFFKRLFRAQTGMTPSGWRSRSLNSESARHAP
jgi:transcriptional regulator GlxA family with amidase domain